MFPVVPADHQQVPFFVKGNEAAHTFIPHAIDFITPARSLAKLTSSPVQ